MTKRMTVRKHAFCFSRIIIIFLQVGVRLSDGREFFAKTIISNATRWDTFGWFQRRIFIRYCC